jgi:site-specific recombinase XerD
VIGAFVVTLAGYQPKTVEHKLCAVRSLLRFAIGEGLVDEAVLGTVPAVRSVKQARIPSVWDPAEVAKVLGDRSRQPVREARLRDRAVDLPARFAGGGRQTP